MNVLQQPGRVAGGRRVDASIHALDGDEDVDEMFLFGVFGRVVFLHLKGQTRGDVAALGESFAIHEAPSGTELIRWNGEVPNGVGAGRQGQRLDVGRRRVLFTDGHAEPKPLLFGGRGGRVVGVDANNERFLREVPELVGKSPVEQFLKKDIIDFGVALEVADLFDIGHSLGRAVLDGHRGEQAGGRGCFCSLKDRGSGQEGRADGEPVCIHDYFPFGLYAAPCGAHCMRRRLPQQEEPAFSTIAESVSILAKGRK